MSSLDKLYGIRDNLAVMLESSNDDKNDDKIKELEEKIEAIKKKKTRGFISDDEADEELDEIQEKVKKIKEKLDKEDEE